MKNTVFSILLNLFSVSVTFCYTITISPPDYLLYLAKNVVIQQNDAENGDTAANGQPGTPAPAKEQPKRLHVSNIPFRFRDPDLRNMFGVSVMSFHYFDNSSYVPLFLHLPWMLQLILYSCTK